jgi:hypothetical protein
LSELERLSGSAIQRRVHPAGDNRAHGLSRWPASSILLHPAKLMLGVMHSRYPSTRPRIAVDRSEHMKLYQICSRASRVSGGRKVHGHHDVEQVIADFEHAWAV